MWGWWHASRLAAHKHVGRIHGVCVKGAHLCVVVQKLAGSVAHVLQVTEAAAGTPNTSSRLLCCRSLPYAATRTTLEEEAEAEGPHAARVTHALRYALPCFSSIRTPTVHA